MGFDASDTPWARRVRVVDSEGYPFSGVENFLASKTCSTVFFRTVEDALNYLSTWVS
jgi:hypothetical protein